MAASLEVIYPVTVVGVSSSEMRLMISFSEVIHQVN